MNNANTSGKLVYLSTYGCQMNVLDSELVRGQLEGLGYSFVDSQKDADVVLLNTCSIREHSEHKVWSALGRLAQIKQDDRPDLVVGVLGCMAEREGEGIVKRMRHVDIICGPSNLDQVPTLVDNAIRNKEPQVSLAGHTVRRSKTQDAAKDNLEALDLSRSFSPTAAGSHQAYVRITRGCNKFCTYCVVPFTRGPEVHRPPEHIVEEVRRLVDRGVKEVTLLGQTVNHYQYKAGDKTTTFADLLWQVHESVPALPRLRFITSYPRDFTVEALTVMASAPRICKYLHIPVQSGSNRILRLMNRGYRIEEYYELIERARDLMPNIRLAGDMIVGFPTETEEDHQASIELLKRVRYKSCYIFKYSERPGTVAIRRYPDDIPNVLKKKRNNELLALQTKVSESTHQSYIGKEIEVLVEGQSKLRTQPQRDLIQLPIYKGSSSRVPLIGRTEGDEIVAFEGPADLIGEFVQVRAVGATPLTIKGEMSSLFPTAAMPLRKPASCNFSEIVERPPKAL